MAVLAVKKHKVKKGDTLEKIARKNGFRKWEVVWGDDQNKKLKTKRKLPKNIEPGDIVVIPFSAKERAELFAQRAKLHLHKLNDWRIEQIMIGQAEELEKTAVLFEKYAKESDRYYRRLLKQQGADLKKIKQLGEGVDIAAEMLTMFANLTRLAKKANHPKTSAEDMVKIRKDVEKIAAKFALDGVNKISSEAKKTAGKYLKKYIPKEIDNAIGELNVIKKSYDNIQKPSFWALSVASLIEGKGWSESVTRDLSEEAKQRIARIDTQRIKEIGKLYRIKNDCEKAAKLRRVEAKNAAVRMKVADKLLTALPEL